MRFLDPPWNFTTRNVRGTSHIQYLEPLRRKIDYFTGDFVDQKSTLEGVHKTEVEKRSYESVFRWVIDATMDY